jgi:hypothetical protein
MYSSYDLVRLTFILNSYDLTYTIFIYKTRAHNFNNIQTNSIKHIIEMELHLQERKSKILFSDSNYITSIQGLLGLRKI